MKRLLLFLLLLTPLGLAAADAPEMLKVLDGPQNSDFLNLHQQMRIVGLLTALSLIPFVVVMMTSFTRLTIVFNFLRQALATQQVPSNQIVVGLSLILTGFVMHPVIDDIYQNALTPYFNDEFKQSAEVQLGLRGEDSILLEKMWTPMRAFLMHHTRESDLQLFLEIGHVKLPKIDAVDIGTTQDTGAAYDLSAVPWYCLVPGFVLSELRTAFIMGFLLFMPFLVIDMIIASILMSMGMMMLPPVMISMPFKILLFIMVDGWRLIIQQMVSGYHMAGG